MTIKISKQQVTAARPLKVYSKYTKRGKDYVIFPEIRLCGKWVQKEGFNYGEEIRVLHKKNRIIITNAEKIAVIL